MQDKVCELLVLFFTQMRNEGLRRELFAKLVRRQAVLCKGVIKVVDHVLAVRCELFLLFRHYTVVRVGLRSWMDTHDHFHQQIR